MRQKLHTAKPRLLVLVLIFASFVSAAEFILPPKASAAELGSRTLQLSDSEPGKSGVVYNISFQIPTAGTLGSVEFLFCSNSTFPTDVCVAPSGMDARNVVFSVESGISGFTVSNTTANEIIISRPASPTLSVSANVLFNNITNPTDAGSYYLRVLTFPTTDASGAFTDNGGMAFSINVPLNVQARVPPYLLFCTGNTISGTDCTTASGDFIELGQLSTTRTSSGQSQMVVATNAKNGYSIVTTGNTLTSGNNTIPPLSVNSPSQVGVSQFGINLRANTSPLIGENPSGPGGGEPTTNYDQSNLYHYANGDVVATNSSVEGGRKYSVSYVTNISKSQPPGIYASTFTYVATGNF